MKKKIFIIFLALLTLLLLSACGKKELTDGLYTAETELSGGSGRAFIEQTYIEISGENITAGIVWSSPWYEYMLIDGVRYEPVQESGNSAFEIPVKLDKDIHVSACTVAMSEPHIIDYTIKIPAASLRAK